MGQVLVFKGPREIGFEEYEEPSLQPDEVRLRTIYSGISAGTQLTAYRGTNPFATKKWNNDLRLFEKETQNYSFYPVKGAWGYEEVGTVVEVGSSVKKISLGDIIYGTWGHKSSNIVSEDFAVNHKLKEGIDPIIAIYSQMGCISLNAVLDADIHIGETVAVFGQGVPGQIVTQLAKLNGARVIAVDANDSRLEYSKKFGADITLNPQRCDVAKEIKALTDNLGADIAIEISGVCSALHEAIRCVTYNGKVVCSGFLQGGADSLFLGEEFHHNRVQMVCSQINAVAPSLSYRWNRLRMERTVFDMVKSGKLNLEGLITHVIPFSEAAKAYDMLDKGTENCLQVVLKFE
ncbi:MAG: zinc-binding alcohol dehydrogenase [Clostridia bacterium]|nr:zinc-binding alcohol dehydrogenase [Clostridia bacterium]